MTKPVNNNHRQALMTREREANKQLDELLKTNKILLANKRQICITKVETYDKQIEKIMTLLKWPKMTSTPCETTEGKEESINSDNSDQGQSLQNINLKEVQDQANENEADKIALLSRLEIIRSKRSETLIRLQDLTQMEAQLEEVHEPNEYKNIMLQTKQQDQDRQHLKLSLKIKPNSSKQNRQSQLGRQEILNNTSKTKKCYNEHFDCKQQWRIKQTQKQDRQNLKQININSIKPSICESKSKQIRRKQCNKSSKQESKKQAKYEPSPITKETKVKVREFSLKNCLKQDNSAIKSTSQQRIINNKNNIENNKNREHKCCRHAKEASDRNQIMINHQAIISDLVQSLINEFSNSECRLNTHEDSQYEYQGQFVQTQQKIIPQTCVFKKTCEWLMKAKQMTKILSRSKRQAEQQTQQAHLQIVKLRQKEQKRSIAMEKEQLMINQQKKELNQLKMKQNDMANQLIKIQKECEAHCLKIQVKQQQYESLGKQIEEIERYKQEIQANMQDLLSMYTRNMKQVQSQLTQVYQQMTNTAKTQKSKSKQRSGKNSKRGPSAQSELEQINRRVLEVHEQINATAQTQKVLVLQNKETILSLEYQVELLKGEEQRLQRRSNQLLQRIQKNSLALEQIEKQRSKYTKDKDKLFSQCIQTRQQIQQFENLVAIRKKCYQDLEQKYNNLKSKKTRLDKATKCLEDQMQQKQIKLHKIGENLEREQKHLFDIKQEIKQSLIQKEQLALNNLKCESTLSDTQLKLKTMQSELCKLSQETLKSEQKLNQLNKLIDQKSRVNNSHQNVRNQLNKLIDELKDVQSVEQRKLQRLLIDINQKQKLAKSKLKQIQETQIEFQQLQAQLVGTNSKVDVLNQHQRVLNSQIKKLTAIKEQLEEGLSELMSKKQQAFTYITCKYEELETMEATTQMLSAELELKRHECVNKLSEIHSLEEKFQIANTELIQASQKASAIWSNLEKLLSTLQINKDEQQNLQARVQMLRQLEKQILVRIAVKVYSQSNSSQSVQCESVLELISNAQKQQIQTILGELASTDHIKDRLELEKQENRKLRLDNQRLCKLYHIELNDHIS